MSHTPGIWIARQEFANHWAIEVPMEGFVPTTIAHVSTTTLGMGSNSKHTGPNALLIAAAPELLDCLKIFVSDCDRTGIKDFNIPHLLPRARAAIAKAEGKS